MKKLLKCLNDKSFLLDSCYFYNCYSCCMSRSSMIRILSAQLICKLPILISLNSDVESQSRDRHLSVVEEGENSDSGNHLNVPKPDSRISSTASSAENLSANIKNSTSLYQAQSAPKIGDIPEAVPFNTRRPSVLLQEILSTRRPSAIMAALRRPSHSFLNFRRHDEGAAGSVPNVGAKSPEAVESIRKNRRIGE